MPAIMMRPVAGSNPVASGSKMAMVAGGPRPGRIPTSVPSRQPTTNHNRLVGVNAACRPESSPSIALTDVLLEESRSFREIRSLPYRSRWQLHLEQDLEQ